jgi:hypothetical protein
MKVFQLPLPVYEIIRDFIVQYLLDSRFLRNGESGLKYWRSFLSCSKAFNDIEKEWNYWIFKGTYADGYLRYLKNNPGRDTVTYREICSFMNRISRSSKQICLICVDDPSWLFETGYELNVLAFKAYVLSSPCELLSNSSFLKNVKYVNLRGDFHKSIEDLSCVSNCYYVDLSSHDSLISDRNIHFFSGVKILRLKNCLSVRNVGCLGSVSDISLSGCPNVTDVSMLGNVHFLDISWCLGITDISALNGVSYLNITGCKNIQKGINPENCRIKEIYADDTNKGIVEPLLDKGVRVIIVEFEDEEEEKEEEDEEENANDEEEEEQDSDA